MFGNPRVSSPEVGRVDYNSLMLIHTVYFWLKDEYRNDADKAQFKAGVETLMDIPSAEQVFVGTPAGTLKRPVVDDSYDVALTVICDSVASHDAYQEHAIHHKFLEDHISKVAKVLVYDAD